MVIIFPPPTLMIRILLILTTTTTIVEDQETLKFLQKQIDVELIRKRLNYDKKTWTGNVLKNKEHQIFCSLFLESSPFPVLEKVIKLQKFLKKSHEFFLILLI